MALVFGTKIAVNFLDLKSEACYFWGKPQGVSELTDRRGCAILALEVVPKNLIFA